MAHSDPTKARLLQALQTIAHSDLTEYDDVLNALRESLCETPQGYDKILDLRFKTMLARVKVRRIRSDQERREYAALTP